MVEDNDFIIFWNHKNNDDWVITLEVRRVSMMWDRITNYSLPSSVFLTLSVGQITGNRLFYEMPNSCLSACPKLNGDSFSCYHAIMNPRSCLICYAEMRFICCSNETLQLNVNKLLPLKISSKFQWYVWEQVLSSQCPMVIARNLKAD